MVSRCIAGDMHANMRCALSAACAVRTLIHVVQNSLSSSGDSDLLSSSSEVSKPSMMTATKRLSNTNVAITIKEMKKPRVIPFPGPQPIAAYGMPVDLRSA